MSIQIKQKQNMFYIDRYIGSFKLLRGCLCVSLSPSLFFFFLVLFLSKELLYIEQ